MQPCLSIRATTAAAAAEHVPAVTVRAGVCPGACDAGRRACCAICAAAESCCCRCLAACHSKGRGQQRTCKVRAKASPLFKRDAWEMLPRARSQSAQLLCAHRAHNMFTLHQAASRRCMSGGATWPG